MPRILRLGAVLLLPLGLAACATDDMAPFGRSGPGVQEDSPTVRRVRGQEVELPPLTYEPGTVWPAPSAEPPRTLFPADPPPAPPPARRSSPRAESPLPPPDSLRSTAVAPLSAPPPHEGRPRPARGSPLPGGRVVTGEAGPDLLTTLSPQGAGLALREGPAVLAIGPGGEVRPLPAPR